MCICAWGLRPRSRRIDRVPELALRRASMQRRAWPKAPAPFGFGRRGASCFVVAPSPRANSSVRRAAAHLAPAALRTNAHDFRYETLECPSTRFSMSFRSTLSARSRPRSGSGWSCTCSRDAGAAGSSGRGWRAPWQASSTPRAWSLHRSASRRDSWRM